jgi:hypothetical protein
VWNASGGGDAAKMKELIAKLEDACGAVGRDVSEIRRSLQFGWDGKDGGPLLEESARYLELGFTEQVIYLRGEDPGSLAAKVGDLLPELRQVERARS